MFNVTVHKQPSLCRFIGYLAVTLAIVCKPAHADLRFVDYFFVSGDPLVDVALNPNTGQVFTVGEIGTQFDPPMRASSGLTIRNEATGQFSGLNFGVGSHVYGVAVNPNTNRAYVALGSYAAVIDGATGTTVGSLGFPAFGVAVDPNTNRIFLFGSSGAFVNVVEANGTFKAKIPLPTFPFFTVMGRVDTAVDPTLNRLYVSYRAEDNFTNQVVVLDAATLRVVEVRAGGSEQINVNTVTHALTFAASDFNSRANRLYRLGSRAVGSKTVFFVSAFDADTFELLSSVDITPAFDTPKIVAVNQATGTIYAFSDGGSGYVVRDDDLGADTTRPIVTLTSPVNGARSSAFPAITGTARDNLGGQGLERVVLFIKRSSDGKYFTGRNWSVAPVELPVNLSAPTAELHAFAFNTAFAVPSGVNLRADTYFITAAAQDRARDEQGRPNRNSATVSIRIIDATAPIVAFSYPSDGQQLSQLTKVSGTLTDDEGGTGPARVLVQIRRVSDGKYFDGTRWTSTAVALPTRLIGTGRAVAWERPSGLPPAASRADTYRITAVGFDRSFNRSVAQTNEVMVGTVPVAT